VLNAGAADAQLKAAEVLARLGTATPAVIAPLLQALKTGDLRLRCAAAKSLGLLRDKSTADALLAALQDQESAVRGAAAEALGQLGDKRAAQPVMEILRTALAADDKDLILATTRALGRLEVKESVELILPLVQRTGKDERDMAGTAATALGRIRDPRAVDALVGLMLTNLWGPCFDAARALGQIGDARAVESLESLVLRVNPRPFPEFPAVALEALGKIRDGKAVQALFNVLKAPDNATHKFAAEALIAQGETALPVLMQVLGEDDEKMRGLAAQILGYIGQPAIEALVTFTANPPHTGGLSAAIYALSSIRDQRVVEPLVGLLKHENAGIRANAAWALGFSNDKRALEALQVAAETDAEPKVRSAAASARERVQGDLANAAASTAQR
jgi:HEAT repeat protein